MTATNTNNGFIIIGDSPELSPLEELESLIDKLDAYRERLQHWRDQERSLCDEKIYTKHDDTFYEVELAGRLREAG